RSDKICRGDGRVCDCDISAGANLYRERRRRGAGVAASVHRAAAALLPAADVHFSGDCARSADPPAALCASGDRYVPAAARRAAFGAGRGGRALLPDLSAAASAGADAAAGGGGAALLSALKLSDPAVRAGGQYFFRSEERRVGSEVRMRRLRTTSMTADY